MAPVSLTTFEFITLELSRPHVSNQFMSPDAPFDSIKNRGCVRWISSLCTCKLEYMTPTTRPVRMQANNAFNAGWRDSAYRPVGAMAMHTTQHRAGMHQQMSVGSWAHRLCKRVSSPGVLVIQGVVIFESFVRCDA